MTCAGRKEEETQGFHGKRRGRLAQRETKKYEAKMQGQYGTMMINQCKPACFTEDLPDLQIKPRRIEIAVVVSYRLWVL